MVLGSRENMFERGGELVFGEEGGWSGADRFDIRSYKRQEKQSA